MNGMKSWTIDVDSDRVDVRDRRWNATECDMSAEALIEMADGTRVTVRSVGEVSITYYRHDATVCCADLDLGPSPELGDLFSCEHCGTRYMVVKVRR